MMNQSRRGFLSILGAGPVVARPLMLASGGPVRAVPATVGEYASGSFIHHFHIHASGAIDARSAARHIAKHLRTARQGAPDGATPQAEKNSV